MSMKPCRECKKEISSEAKTCPNCGVKKPHRDKIGMGGAIVLAVAALLILGALISEPEPESAEDRAARLEQEAAEAAASIAEAAEEKRKGLHCLSGWDGAHTAFKQEIKKSMRDPGSFEHIETRIGPVTDKGAHLLVMEFRAGNGFGGMDVASAYATVENEDCTHRTVGGKR